jgi:hypothetical protein
MRQETPGSGLGHPIPPSKTRSVPLKACRSERHLPTPNHSRDLLRTSQQENLFHYIGAHRLTGIHLAGLIRQGES